MLDILAYIIPVLSVVVSFFLGKFQTSQTSKMQSEQQRYEKLYVPFIRWFYIYHPWDNLFTELPRETRFTVLSLLLNNIEQMDNDSVALLQTIYQSNVVYDIPAEDAFEQFFNRASKEELNASFYELSRCMLLHSLKLSKRLYKPQIALNALASLNKCDHRQ